MGGGGKSYIWSFLIFFGRLGLARGSGLWVSLMCVTAVKASTCSSSRKEGFFPRDDDHFVPGYVGIIRRDGSPDDEEFI